MNSSPHVSIFNLIRNLFKYKSNATNIYGMILINTFYQISKLKLFLLQDYVPHCSPVEQIPNTMQAVAENRHFSIGTMVSPKSGPGRPSISQQQSLFNASGSSTHLPSTQVQPILASSQMPPRSAQVPLSAPLPHHYQHQQQQEQSTSTGNADIPSTRPSNATNAMFRVQMWSNNFDSGVHSMNHSSVSLFSSSISIFFQLSFNISHGFAFSQILGLNLNWAEFLT